MYLVIQGTLYHGTKCTTPKYHGSFSMVYRGTIVCNLPWSTSGVVFCIVESDDNTTCYTFACGRLVNLHSTHIIIYHTAIS